MNIVELQDGFNLHANEKVFWLSRESGWTREQVAQILTILDDCIQKLEFDLADSEDTRYELTKECDDLRDEIWDYRDKLNEVMAGVCD